MEYLLPTVILILGIIFLLYRKYYTWDTDNFQQSIEEIIIPEEYKINGYFNGPEDGDYSYPYKSIYSEDFDPFKDLPVYNAN